MSIFCFKSSKSNNPVALYNIINYISDKSKTPTGAVGSTHFPKDFWLKMASLNKVIHGKENYRQYQHGVLSFADYDAVQDYPTAMRIGKEVASILDLPSMYTAHIDTKHLHLHFVWSATSIEGHQFGLSPKLFSHFMCTVGDIVEKYGCKRPMRQKIIEVDEIMEDNKMEESFVLEPAIIEPNESDYEVVTPCPVPEYRDRRVKAKLIDLKEEQDFETCPPDRELFVIGKNYPDFKNIGTLDLNTGQLIREGNSLSDNVGYMQRNRFYINNAPEIRCNTQEQAEQFVFELNKQCAELTGRIVGSINNGLPVDAVLNFAPKIDFHK